VEEERRWFDLVRELNALGHIYYRRRVLNEGKKSGNVRDFLSHWGRRYRYFMVLDADSVMRGETVVDLVKLMEAHPGVGLIQTVPGLVNAESLFGRIQQFANRLYAPVFITGLNYWAQGFGNYWGHNAIIRTEPFMQCCDLPQLPGRKPFGGQILSHDFVEAALMLRENWQVWFAYDLEGSYEEAPQGLIENAQRDRRWCEGNLQHGMVLCAKGLRGISRIHLSLGIFGYLAGPLWLLFLLTFHWIRSFHEFTGLSDITVPAFTPYLSLTGMQHAFLLFSLCMLVLMLPKMLALVELAFDHARRRSFGGLGRAVASTVGETVFSTLHAPLQMLWHTGFVANILFGTGVTWGSQKRSAHGTAWSYAIQRHWVHTSIGVIWGALVWHLDRAMFWWFAPVLAGMVLSIPLSVVTSNSSWGWRARRVGLFTTPEENVPPSELTSLHARMAEHELVCQATPRKPNSNIADAVLDPYINAMHVSLQSERRLNPGHTDLLKKLADGQDDVRSLSEKLLAAGPDALSQKEKLLVLSNCDSMAWLHKRAWLQPVETLAPWWQEAIRRYSC
jgi:membrane glycosyltransferase